MKKKVEIFIAYSHDDLVYKDRLKKALGPLLRTGEIAVWDDRDIDAGGDWDSEIKKRLNGADIILLLVSPDSLASDYFYGKEVSVSLERHERGEAIVIPVILRPCLWDRTPLSRLEALPTKGKAVTQWPSQDEAFMDIAHRIDDAITNITARKAAQKEEAQRRQDFQAAVNAAEHLRRKANWPEALRAYDEALNLHLPGFTPDAAELARFRETCETNVQADLQRKAEYERRIAEAQKHLRRRAWPKAVKAAQSALEAIPGDAAAQELLRQANEGGKTPVSPILNARWAAIAAGSLIAVIVLWKVASSSSGLSAAAQEEAVAIHKADSIGTLPALHEFVKNYPESDRIEEFRRRIDTLDQQYKNHLNDAKLFIDDDPATACEYLKAALGIAPDDPVVLAEMKKLSCL